MNKFTVREQLIFLIIIFFVLTILAIWGIKKFNNNENLMQIKLDRLNDQLKQIRYLSNELFQLQKKLTPPVMPQSLSSFVENIARSIGIQDNLQLNELTNVKKGIEGLKVALDSLKLDNLISMLYKLENHRPVLKISHLSISISPGERTIRSSFHVKKQKID